MGAASKIYTQKIRPVILRSRSWKGDDAPLRLPADTPFITDPAGVRTSDGDQALGLQLANQGVKARPVVALEKTTRLRPIQPDLPQRAVMREQFPELIFEVLVIGLVIPGIGRMIEVRRRQIQSQAEPGLPACLSQVLDDITLARLPGAPPHAMLRVGAGPEAESVMMFGHQDDRPGSRLAAHTGPLMTIQRGGI